MAVGSISSASPIMSASALATVSRPSETPPDDRQSATQESDARRVAASESAASQATLSGPEGSRLAVIAAPNDAESSYKSASSEISREYQGGAPSSSEMRSASDAYRAEATARDDLDRQQQDNGVRGLDVTA
jgi:hypothetical protein